MSNFVISGQARWALDMLSTPVLIVRAAKRQLAWANTAAITYFGGQSVEDLQRHLSDDQTSGFAALLHECFSAFGQAGALPEARRVLQNGTTLARVPDAIKTDDNTGADAVIIEIRQAHTDGNLNATILSDASNSGELDEHADELAAALNRERGVYGMQLRMLEIASHEFRTPLAVIDGAAQRISRRVNKDAPEQIIALADRIREFVGRLASLLDHTIERAKKNLTQIECIPTRGYLQYTVTQAASMFDEQTEIEIDEEVNALPALWFDQLLIEHALINLVGNAVKYSDAPARVRFSATSDDDYLTLYVRDFGIGINLEEREIVFDQRVRGRNVGARAGTGLGLYIVKSIMRAHGGAISVEQPDGPGTLLKMVLPLRPSPGQSDSPRGEHV